MRQGEVTWMLRAHFCIKKPNVHPMGVFKKSHVFHNNQDWWDFIGFLWNFTGLYRICTGFMGFSWDLRRFSWDSLQNSCKSFSHSKTSHPGLPSPRTPTSSPAKCDASARHGHGRTWHLRDKQNLFIEVGGGAIPLIFPETNVAPEDRPSQIGK